MEGLLLLPFSFSNIFSMVSISSNPIPADIMYATKPEIHSGITGIDSAGWVKLGWIYLGYPYIIINSAYIYSK